MNYEIYHIPTNFTDAGRVMGLFELRNLVETVILTVPVLYLCIAFLPFALTTKIIVTLTVVVPLGGFGLIGINDDSMTRWLGSWWRWRRGRRIILFRGEEMNLKELLFGGGVQSGDSGGAYRDSIQAWLPIKNIIGGVVITKDNRFVKILEVLPVNIYLKSINDRQNIISSFAAYLKIAPNDLQMIARTLPADTQAYVEQMQRYAEHEDNEACREMIEDNIREIGHGIASNAMRHRFFLVFQYEAGMRAKRNTVQAIVQRLNEEADTARRYLDLCELEVMEPRYCDNFILKLLYEILSKKTSQRVRLPDGVFDMTTAVHGIYEE